MFRDEVDDRIDVDDGYDEFYPHVDTPPLDEGDDLYRISASSTHGGRRNRPRDGALRSDKVRGGGGGARRREKSEHPLKKYRMTRKHGGGSGGGSRSRPADDERTATTDHPQLTTTTATSPDGSTTDSVTSLLMTILFCSWPIDSKNN